MNAPMLNIESILQQETNQPFFSRYNVLKDRFFSQEQNYWLANFQGGNDHGPGHLQRVLEHLDQLVGRDPVKQGLFNIYELYLAMMAVLYHDVGLLRGRDKHADTSGLLVGDEANYYIFQNWDLKIIRAVVVSHSSSKDIEQECAMFNDTIQVNQYQARPKVIAALLRLADELDEDSRRADPHVMKKLNLPATSEFFWEFSQRISGITADIKT